MSYLKLLINWGILILHQSNGEPYDLRETKFYYKVYKGFCVAVQYRDNYFLENSCSTLANKM